jgi:hypothetical protein
MTIFGNQAKKPQLGKVGALADLRSNGDRAKTFLLSRVSIVVNMPSGTRKFLYN